MQQERDRIDQREVADGELARAGAGRENGFDRASARQGREARAVDTRDANGLQPPVVRRDLLGEEGAPAERGKKVPVDGFGRCGQRIARRRRAEAIASVSRQSVSAIVSCSPEPAGGRPLIQAPARHGNGRIRSLDPNPLPAAAQPLAAVPTPSPPDPGGRRYRKGTLALLDVRRIGQASRGRPCAVRPACAGRRECGKLPARPGAERANRTGASGKVTEE